LVIRYITRVFALLLHVIEAWFRTSLFSFGGLIDVCCLFQLADIGAYDQTHRLESA